MKQPGGVRRGGLKAEELGKQLGKSGRSVVRVFAEPREDYLARANVRRKRVVELRGQGMTVRAIAEEVGVSVGTVHRYIKEADSG